MSPPPSAFWLGSIVLAFLDLGWGLRVRPTGPRTVRAWAVHEDGRQASAEGERADALLSLLQQVDRLYLAELAPGEAELDRAREHAQMMRDLVAERLRSYPLPPVELL